MILNPERQKQKDIIDSTRIVGAFLTALTVEESRQYTEKSENYSEETMVYKHIDPSADRSIVVIPGCGSVGELYEEIWDPLLKEKGSRLYVSHPNGRHSVESNKQGLMGALEDVKDTEKSFVVSSMGLLVLMNCLTDPEVREAVGHIASIDVDSGLTSRLDLQPGSARALGITALVPPFAIIEAGYRITREHSAKKAPYGDTTISKEQALRYHLASARVPYSVARTQYETIRETPPLEPGVLAVVRHENPGMAMRHTMSLHDGIVNTTESHKRMEVIFQEDIPVRVDKKRHFGSHAGGIERPDFMLEGVAEQERSELVAA
jgi:hypothetical protein